MIDPDSYLLLVSGKESRQVRLEGLDDDQYQNCEKEHKRDFVEDSVEHVGTRVLVVGEASNHSSTKSVIAKQEKNKTYFAPKPSARYILDPRKSGYPQPKD